jgi:hypothetical protein
MASCQHPAQRLYSWHAHNVITDKNDWLVIGCCECGEVLKGSTEDYETYLEMHNSSYQGEQSW